MGVAVKIIITTGYPQGAGSSPLCGWWWISTISLSPYLNSLWVEPICTPEPGSGGPLLGSCQVTCQPQDCLTQSLGSPQSSLHLLGTSKQVGWAECFHKWLNQKPKLVHPQTRRWTDPQLFYSLFSIDFFFFLLLPLSLDQTEGTWFFPEVNTFWV